MTNCPPKLRGDLSKWLMEINTGVYVGHLNTRVREALWKRICENIRDGQATMVFTTNNEQHMDFYVHNTSWQPVDFNGIKLIKHPDMLNYTPKDELQCGFSNEAKRLMSKRRRKKSSADSYVILDIETTGFSIENDDIIEIGAIEIRGANVVKEYSELISINVSVPETIRRVTGIDNNMLKEKGRDICDVLRKLFEIISGKTVFIYNAPFDLGFLKKEAERNNLEFPDINVKDLLVEARSKISDAANYKLEVIAEHLGIICKQKHRAVDDCRLLHEVYIKLNEI